MSKKLITLMGAVSLSLAVQAEMNLSFDNINEPQEINSSVKTFRDTRIIEEDGNKFLRMHTPAKSKPSAIKIPTGISGSENYSLSFDWRNSARKSGKILSLCDWNHNKQAMSLVIENGKFAVTSYTGSRFKHKRLSRYKAGTWNRIKIDVSGGTYTVKIKDLSTGEELYNSIEKKKTLKLNTAVTPKLMFMSQWPGQGQYSYDYDNINLSLK